MKVLYDSQVFDMQKSGGISRYFIEIIKNLPKNIEYQLPLTYSDNVYLNEYKITDLYNNSRKEKYYNFIPNLNFKGKYRLKLIRNKLFYSDFKDNRLMDIEALKNQNFDIFHPTYYDPYFLDFIGNKPYVLTIHDMIHEKYPEMLLDIKTIYNKKLLANNAEHIIAISEQTKQDIIDILRIPEKKISVIYHGTTNISISENNYVNKYGKYFLFTGTRLNYKNFNFMLISLADWLHEHKDVKLLCTSSPFNELENKLIISLGLENQIINVFFSNDFEMYQLYHNAIAFIFPSYAEGFGIPVLEAFQAECPVILTEIPCFKEIACDAGIYFSPKKKNELVYAVNLIYSDSAIRDKLILAGKRRLSSFSWEKTAIQTSNVYYNCL